MSILDLVPTTSPAPARSASWPPPALLLVPPAAHQVVTALQQLSHSLVVLSSMNCEYAQ